MKYVGNDLTVSMNTDNVVQEFNKAVEEKRDYVKEELDRKLKAGREVIENSQKLEIVPTNNYVLIRPFAENPFEALREENGLIIPSYDGKFKNPDTGEEDQEYNISSQAEVVEVGPMVKYVQPGDVIYYRSHCTSPIPFFSQGLEVIAENQIHVVINEGVKERFKKINDGK